VTGECFFVPLAVWRINGADDSSFSLWWWDLVMRVRVQLFCGSGTVKKERDLRSKKRKEGLRSKTRKEGLALGAKRRGS
jgi:hypothetical protein